jgi:tRNA threonylcarbamoyl adenosine modification protein (Sua5/YciO/YrdC/YwlC family)
MKTKIEKINKEQINKEILAEAGELLKKGGLVAFPTETVYGLGANALDEEAARKTYAAKGRPSDNPLIVHIARMEDLPAIVKSVPEKAKTIAERFWPGPLTMIFEKSEIVPYPTTGGLETVAVRMPSDEIAKELILAGGGYVSAPSANTSGRPSPTTAQHVAEDMDGKIEMILDGGAVDIGVESTILDMTVTPPMILRPGAITREMLEKVVGEVAVDKTILDANSKTPPKAPGMKYRHYAPKAELSIVEGELTQVISFINRIAGEKIKEGFKVGVIGTEETVGQYLYGDVKCVGTREDEMTIAGHLYGILREFDADGVDYIYSEAFATEGIGSAVMNRLLKAAGHQVVRL